MSSQCQSAGLRWSFSICIVNQTVINLVQHDSFNVQRTAEYNPDSPLLG